MDLKTTHVHLVQPEVGLPRGSWWAEPVQGSFYQRCLTELSRMRHSKEHRRLGLPLVVGQVDGKQRRWS
jgi:hypothetical protein